MSYVILAFVILAISHFVYESILAPTLRMQIRFDLFALRDELRRLKIVSRNDLDDRHFHYLQDSINAVLAIQPRLSISTMVNASAAIESDKELRQRMRDRAQILDDCKLTDARRIRERTLALALRAVTVNSGGWAFYVLPLVLASSCYDATKRKVKALVSLSEPDVERIMPSNGAAGIP